jgi:hypothetical protein
MKTLEPIYNPDGSLYRYEIKGKRESRFVYFIKVGEYYKIGRAANIKKRIKQLQTGSPHEIILVDYYDTGDAVAEEKRWHEKYKDKRMKGEFFNLSDRDIRDIKEEIKFLNQTK